MKPSTGSGSWLAFRVALAVTLTVAFYAGALGLAISMLVFAGASLQADRIPVRLVVFALVGAGAILYGTFPRPDRFVAPGPRLTEKTQPRLFAVLRSVAKAVGGSVPAEVYLVADVNAGVLQRGGMLGFGGRRVMVLGLPLLATLRTSELRGVLAHEYGHYIGGETRFGPWIYRTQEAIQRTVHSLSEAGSWLSYLFLWYGKAFLRITKAVSRRQELAADRLASEVAGASAVAGGLRTAAGTSAAYSAYMAGELAPVLDSGWRPPILDGFRRFLAAEGVASDIAGFVNAESREGAWDPYDSHPPLGVRLDALGNPPPVPPRPQDPPAIELLDDLDGLEEELLSFAFEGGKMPPRITWEETGERVFLPAWKRQLQEARILLEGMKPTDLPERLRGPAPNSRWRRPAMAQESPAGVPRVGIATAIALLLHLRAEGWTLRCLPGQPVALLWGDDAFFPFREVEDLRSGATSAEGWIERCRILGVADLSLDAVGLDGPAA